MTSTLEIAIMGNGEVGVLDMEFGLGICLSYLFAYLLPFLLFLILLFISSFLVIDSRDWISWRRHAFPMSTNCDLCLLAFSATDKCIDWLTDRCQYFTSSIETVLVLVFCCSCLIIHQTRFTVCRQSMYNAPRKSRAHTLTRALTPSGIGPPLLPSPLSHLSFLPLQVITTRTDYGEKPAIKPLPIKYRR